MLADATLEKEKASQRQFLRKQVLSHALGARPGKTLSKSALS